MLQSKQAATRVSRDSYPVSPLTRPTGNTLSRSLQICRNVQKYVCFPLNQVRPRLRHRSVVRSLNPLLLGRSVFN